MNTVYVAVTCDLVFTAPDERSAARQVRDLHKVIRKMEAAMPSGYGIVTYDHVDCEDDDGKPVTLPDL